ncbi:hypothetical protein DL89DRAFT_86195 [Linderina pennispora]|uniref:Uncharacterized protein n=1 Tax=Linderina pennispora TaxID=61395 RepID=A0A1Y1WHH5_9FUNG|nr:uncharacterized protein DL89DRAFT_86195 [Linderina pennispora]ORX73020.1 hypothetical protein DL89DRAFT_86195 [Linderina pennispora]
MADPAASAWMAAFAFAQSQKCSHAHRQSKTATCNSTAKCSSWEPGRKGDPGVYVQFIRKIRATRLGHHWLDYAEAAIPVVTAHLLEAAAEAEPREAGHA